MAAAKGNTYASKENRIWANAIRHAVTQRKGDKLRALAEKLIDRAGEGDISALKELGDRLDGKPAQVTQHEVNPDANILRIVHESK